MPDGSSLVWIDGRLAPADEASVSPFDHGLVVGDGAFETLKVLNRTPFAIKRHIRRMHSTLAALAISPPPETQLRTALNEVVAGNELNNGRVRLTVTGGLGPLGSGAPGGPATVIAAVEATPYLPVPSAVVAPWTRNEAGALAGLKTTSYAENVRALRFAHDHECGEAILANTRGELCEGTGTNVFVVIGGAIHTPPLSSGCLAGISRELLLETVDVIETSLPIAILDEADEVFLTSSTRDVQAMTMVNARPLDGPGAKTSEAVEEFARIVERDLDP